MLVGHQEVVKALSLRLPPVSIITGPPSVGKRMIAAYAAIANNVARVDFTEVSRLTVDEALRIKQFMITKPMGTVKFALIDLDAATMPAINDLLKVLEAPPEHSRFTLISSTRVPPTLLTRSHKYTVGLLNSDELFKILLANGLSDKDARKVSNLGRVDLAMQAYNDISSRSTALTVLQAVESNDFPLFVTAYKSVDEKAAKLIINILEEAASQRWKMFSPEYLGAFAQKNVALNVLAAWSNVSNARPQLAVRAALESVMRG